MPTVDASHLPCFAMAVSTQSWWTLCQWELCLRPYWDGPAITFIHHLHCQQLLFSSCGLLVVLVTIILSLAVVYRRPCLFLWGQHTGRSTGLIRHNCRLLSTHARVALQAFPDSGLPVWAWTFVRLSGTSLSCHCRLRDCTRNFINRCRIKTFLWRGLSSVAHVQWIGSRSASLSIVLPTFMPRPSESAFEIFWHCSVAS